MGQPQLLRTVSKLTLAESGPSQAQPLNQGYQFRLLELTDASKLYSVIDANRTYLREWLPWLDQTHSPNDSRAFIQETQQKLNANVGLTLAICQNDCLSGNPIQDQQRQGISHENFGGAIAGLISLDPIDWHSRSSYIGYWLAEQHQGQGLITQACRALIHYGFSELKLERTIIACATKNHKSRAIPERLGFIYDGRIRQAEQLSNRAVDHEVYVMFRRAWLSSAMT